MKAFLRRIRGFLYRAAPGQPGFFQKKLAGYERRWDLEARGFTKEGFFRVLCDRFGLFQKNGFLVEMVAGDGWVL